MREWMNIIKESVSAPVTLYHGTCPDSAAALCTNGWAPNGWSQGGNMGQARYLYLTSHPDDAEWFANEKGCSTVVELTDVPLDALKVDPEDGFGDTVEDELNSPHGLPGKVVLIRPLGPEHFRVVRR